MSPFKFFEKRKLATFFIVWGIVGFVLQKLNLDSVNYGAISTTSTIVSYIVPLAWFATPIGLVLFARKWWTILIAILIEFFVLLIVLWGYEGFAFPFLLFFVLVLGIFRFIYPRNIKSV